MLGVIILSGVIASAQSPAHSAEYTELLNTARKVGPHTDFGPLLDQLVAQHQAATGLAESHARIEVLQQLAEMDAKEGRSLQANARLGNAIAIAEALREPHHLFQLYFRSAELLLETNERPKAAQQAYKAWELARLSQRGDQQVQAGLLLGELYHRQGRWTEFEPQYETMLALPGVDALIIEKHRAARTPRSNKIDTLRRWERVRQLAQERGKSRELAFALDQLAYLQATDKNWAEAIRLFRAADQLATHHSRPPYLIYKYSESLKSQGDAAAADRLLQQVLEEFDAELDPTTAAGFHVQRAQLLAEQGEFESAYGEMEHAHTLRSSPVAQGFVLSAVSAVPTTAQRDVDNAALLATARSALRESELAAARQQRHHAFALGGAALLLASALGVAFHFKRRAAAALATARDAAELRAERTHWQMLRYQLNPHFLFNALTSLSGLATVDPGATRKTIGRLSQFCRLALERTSDDLRTLKEESQLLSAFLDVEKVGLGDRLSTHMEISPAAAQRLLPPLLLQPLVENALKYGSETSGDQMEIRITGDIDEATGHLRLEVANTGTWVDKVSGPPRRDHIGLANVRERLARFTVAPDAFNTVSGDGWVHVRITLPDLRNHALVTR